MEAKDAITRNKTRIVEIFTSDRALILQKVHENELITTREYNNLSDINSVNRETYVIALVDKILFKGEETCRWFLDPWELKDIQVAYPELSGLNVNYTRQADAAAEGRAAVDLSELVSCLNDAEYINWLKAERCLVILKQGLLPFIEQHMREFHQRLLMENPTLGDECQASCETNWKQFSAKCDPCIKWKEVIEKHHRHSTSFQWDNCQPGSWRTHPWEVAWAYMPQGQRKVNKADQFDTSALLHLIKYCSEFQEFQDLKAVNGVITSRNELKHSSDLKMSDNWMKGYENSLKDFLCLCNKPEMESVEREIDELLTADLSVVAPGAARSRLESDADIGPSVNRRRDRWEVELLRERLREFLHAGGGSETQVTKKLNSLIQFVTAFKDLCEKFPA